MVAADSAASYCVKTDLYLFTECTIIYEVFSVYFLNEKEYSGHKNQYYAKEVLSK